MPTFYRKASRKTVPVSGLQMEHAEQDVARLVVTLCGSVDHKDSYTHGHSERVAVYMLHLAQQLYRRFTAADARRMIYAGLLHDVGKVHLPTRLLNKPGKLTDDEYRLIQQHPRIGADIVGQIPALTDTLPIILYHHERYDGKGYPSGLSGQTIPLDARIAGVADAFDALTSTRSYRSTLSLDRALEEIIVHNGTQFDPGVVAVFVKEYDAIRRLYHQLHRGSAPNALFRMYADCPDYVIKYVAELETQYC